MAMTFFNLVCTANIKYVNLVDLLVFLPKMVRN